MIRSSVVIMTKNEERNIAAAIKSVSSFAEVFVVDSGSTDKTKAIAVEHGALVHDFVWNGQYPKKKQWCLETLPFSHNWVLYLDADEVVTPPLIDEIRVTLEGRPAAVGFFIGLDYVFLGKTLRHGQRVYKLALLDRRYARFPDYDDLDATNMWEVEGHYQPQVAGDVGTLQGRIEHRDHDDLFHYFERHNRYSDWEARLRRKVGGRRNTERLSSDYSHARRVFDALPFRAPAFFLNSYIFRGGFLDGRAGFHYALAKAFYYWQIRVKEIECARHDR